MVAQRLSQLLLLFLFGILPATSGLAEEGFIRDLVSGSRVSKTMLIKHLKTADIVMLGEVHDNPDHHRIQADIIKSLVDAGHPPALYLEMLSEQEEIAHESFRSTWLESKGSSIDKDHALQDALAWERRGWPIWESYAPIFRLADQHDLPIRHADPPAELIRNVSRFGLLAIPRQLRLRLFGSLEASRISELSERLRISVQVSHRLSPESPQVAGLIQAQMTRDAYMASKILQAQSLALLIAGVEHVRKDRGVPFHLASVMPQLKVVSVALLGTGCDDANANAFPFDYLWLDKTAASC